MSKLDSESGLVQSVTPSQRIESYQSDSLGHDNISGGEAVEENIVQAQADPDAPINTAPYDGNSAFGPTK